MLLNSNANPDRSLVWVFQIHLSWLLFIRVRDGFFNTHTREFAGLLHSFDWFHYCAMRTPTVKRTLGMFYGILNFLDYKKTIHRPRWHLHMNMNIFLSLLPSIILYIFTCGKWHINSKYCIWLLSDPFSTSGPPPSFLRRASSSASVVISNASTVLFGRISDLQSLGFSPSLPSQIVNIAHVVSSLATSLRNTSFRPLFGRDSLPTKVGIRWLQYPR